MNILVDIDGVICQYDFPALTLEYFGVEIPMAGIWTYSIEDSLGVSSQEVADMFAIEAFAPPVFFDRALEVLNRWTTRGDNVVINSNRIHFMGEEGLVMWLNEHQIPYTDVSFKTNLTNFNYYIDDSPRKLMSTPFYIANKLLFRSPWNDQCLDIKKAMRVVHNWNEIEEIVNESK